MMDVVDKEALHRVARIAQSIAQLGIECAMPIRFSPMTTRFRSE